LPALQKYGYNEPDSQSAFTNLNKYWLFLRKHVQKDEARKEVDRQVQQNNSGGGRVSSVWKIQTTPKIYTKEEKAAYKLKMDEQRALKKRDNYTTSQSPATPPKRQKSSSQVPTKSSKAEAPVTHVEGTWTRDGVFHSGLQTLQPGVVLPPNFTLPKTMTQHSAVHSKFIDAYLTIFPDMPKNLIVGVVTNAQTFYNKQDRKYRNHCIFHDTMDHPTIQCPTFRCLYPGGDNIPTSKPPPRPTPQRRP
jgi:hypothetical protein